MHLDFPGSIERQFPADFPLAWNAISKTSNALAGIDLSPLSRRSPALRGYDWSAYLTCSVVRMVHALEAVRRRTPAPARVLDYGSYFGNFSLMYAAAGYQVDAVDGYRAYDDRLVGCMRLLSSAGVRVFDFADAGYDLTHTAGTTYDVVLCLGVIEHIAHTPRILLESLNRVLKAGGWLVLDTPNLAYAYNRAKLARGESPFCPIDAQYYTEIPFEGHHREYTVSEVRWMLGELHHDTIEVQNFNYSQFGLKQLTGADVELFHQMERDPSAREIILTISRKPL
jgi:SAM-dependent methyltransferase